jgi:hypothetical protein
VADRGVTFMSVDAKAAEPAVRAGTEVVAAKDDDQPDARVEPDAKGSTSPSADGRDGTGTSPASRDRRAGRSPDHRFGTVIGIVNAFHEIGASGRGGIATVSTGIAEMLVTTAFGSWSRSRRSGSSMR